MCIELVLQQLTNRIIWKFDKKCVFSVSSATRAVMAEEEQAMEINSFSFTKAVWKGLVLPKLEIFAWFLLIGRVNTKTILQRFGILSRTRLYAAYVPGLRGAWNNCFFTVILCGSYVFLVERVEDILGITI